MPKISVVMPVYNGEKYLNEAIDSILNQTFTDFEFIIIDDGSTDSTQKIIKSYDDNRILYVKNEKNLGVAESLNKGIDMAQGEYIARMDADDISLPERFKKQVKFMDRHKNLAVCGGETIVFGNVKSQLSYTVFGCKKVKVAMLFSSSLAHPVVMIRNSVLKKENYRYDKEFDKVEDYDLWLKICEKYDIDNVHGTMLKYRIHESQVTQNYTDDYDSKMRRIRKREFEKFDFSYTVEEFDAFCAYCKNKFNYDKQTYQLALFLDKLYKANLCKKYYDISELGNTINMILISCLAKTDTYDYNDIHKICNLLKMRDLVVINVKQKVKGFLKRVNIC